MTHYAVNISPPPVNSHRFLIGPPLVVVSLFCFAFVLMQPHNQTQAGTAAASHPVIPTASSTQPALLQSSQANLPKLSQAQPVISSPVPVTTDPTTTPASNPTSTLSTTASQSSSTGAAASLQSAKPNHQAGGNLLKSNVDSLIKSLELTK